MGFQAAYERTHVQQVYGIRHMRSLCVVSCAGARSDHEHGSCAAPESAMVDPDSCCSGSSSSRSYCCP
eukprot:5840863-Alexandrium_andersonii.AAC.1